MDFVKITTLLEIRFYKILCGLGMWSGRERGRERGESGDGGGGAIGRGGNTPPKLPHCMGYYIRPHLGGLPPVKTTTIFSTQSTRVPALHDTSSAPPCHTYAPVENLIKK